MKPDKMQKRLTKPSPRFLQRYPPLSKDSCSGMNSTGPRPPIFKPPQFSDYPSASFKDDATVQRFYDEMFPSSDDGKNTLRLQFGSPTLSKIAAVLKEVDLDMARYGYRFPCVDLGEASTVDAPGPSGQVGITTGYYLKSNDSSVVPVREVAALKIVEK